MRGEKRERQQAVRDRGGRREMREKEGRGSRR
jgi:hypothetical protein